MKRVLSVILTVGMLTPGCSVYMSASRSIYKDVGVLKIGAERDHVIAQLGPPNSSIKLENGGYKDVYKIDPEAHRAPSKAAAVGWHLIADVLTLGLWEIVGTPLELAAQDRPVTYIVVYGPDGKLVEMETVK